MTPPVERPPKPQPYYEDEFVTLYLGDCREWMPESFDVIVTDPPYGISYSPGAGGRGFRGAGKPIGKKFVGANIVRGDATPFEPGWLLAYAKPTILFGANHYSDRLPGSPSWIVWDKRDGLPSNDFADCELLWTNIGGPARLFSHRWMGLTKDSERGARGLHPTQKPVDLMRWLLSRCPPGTVLDPFVGSGTTLVAAKDMGRRAIGIEIEERYCEIAANRCRQEVLGLTA